MGREGPWGEITQKVLKEFDRDPMRTLIEIAVVCDTSRQRVHQVLTRWRAERYKGSRMMVHSKDVW